MSTDTDSSSDAEKRFKPHQISLVIGLAIGTITVVSGIIPQITGWENENGVHRTVFGNIPGPLQIAFYSVIPRDGRVGRYRLRPTG